MISLRGMAEKGSVIAIKYSENMFFFFKLKVEIIQNAAALFRPAFEAGQDDRKR